MPLDENKRVLMKLIAMLSRKEMLQIRKIVEPYGLSAAEQPFFMAVNSHEGSTQEELTQLVGVDKAATTRVIHSLEQKGLITRRQDSEDKRQNRIYPTEKARSLYPVVWDALVAFNDIMTDNLSDSCIEMMCEALGTIDANFSRLHE